MAGADVIGTAICIGLFIIVAYLVAGSLLTTTQIVNIALNDIDQQNMARLNTQIEISDVYFWGSNPYLLHFHVQNTGKEVIRNFNTMDVYLVKPSTAPIRYRFDGSLIDPSDGLGIGCDINRTWNYAQFVPPNPDIPRPINLRPNDTMSVRIWNYNSNPANYQVIVVTTNGITDFYTK